MRCERAQVLYSEYVSGTLAPETLSRVEEHLATCPACRNFYEDNDKLGALIRDQGEVAHPGPAYFEGLATRVMGELDRLPPPPPVRNWRRLLRGRPIWWSGAAAAAALLLLALVPLLHRLGRAGADRTAAANVPAGGAGATLKTSDGRAVVLSPPTAGKVLVKGVVNPAGPTTILDDLLPGRAIFDQTPSFARLSELQMIREAELKMASIRNQADRRSVPPDRLLEQIQVLKAQLAVGSNEDLRRGLMELEAGIREQVKDPAEVSKLPAVKQSEYYAKGEEELAAGHSDEAFKYFQRVLLVDATTPLAVRANLQMGDLLFSDKANFKKALEAYRKCQGARAAKALNSAERVRVQRQIELLEKYRADGWQALARLHSVRHDSWPEAVAALRDLTAQPRNQALLPETARAVSERCAAGQKPGPAAMLEIYNLLAARADDQPAGESRAYLELYLGELSIHLAQPRQAVDHFMRATQAADGSVAARMARAKIDELEEKSLKDLVRNGN